MGQLYPWREYLRPWKLAALAAGIALLVAGSSKTLLSGANMRARTLLSPVRT